VERCLGIEVLRIEVLRIEVLRIEVLLGIGGVA
jgi:hypothetical protein